VSYLWKIKGHWTPGQRKGPDLPSWNNYREIIRLFKASPVLAVFPLPLQEPACDLLNTISTNSLLLPFRFFK
jgi:hypothetical protein